MNESELCRDLARLIRGELRCLDLQTQARRAGFDSFAELCESELPEQLGEGIGLTTGDVLTRLDRLLAGEIDLAELYAWADELYNISFNHRFEYEAGRDDLILSALSVLSVICNERLFPRHEHTERTLAYVRGCLSSGRDLSLHRVFLRAFEGLPEAHMATRVPEEPQEEGGEAPGEAFFNPALHTGPRWVDVVLLDSPYRGEDDLSGRYSWVIAFTVVTRDLFDEEIAQAELEGGPGEREATRADRVPVLRRLVPNFAFDRYDPLYVCDGDGIAEIVLDAPGIGPDEVRYAARLFALVNRIGTLHVDGERVRTLVVRPLRRGRARRADQEHRGSC